MTKLAFLGEDKSRGVSESFLDLITGSLHDGCIQISRVEWPSAAASPQLTTKYSTVQRIQYQVTAGYSLQ